MSAASVALFGPPGQIAVAMRSRVTDELGLSCSIGAGPNKLVAKLASKAAKPRASARGPVPGRGTLVVPEAEVQSFLWPLPVEALWGVGQASAERLHKLGVNTVGELAALPVGSVVACLGQAAGQMMHSLAWGRDLAAGRGWAARQVHRPRGDLPAGHRRPPGSRRAAWC